MVLFLFLFGLLLIFTPVILMITDGVEDITEWLMSKPLKYVIYVKFMVHTGIGLLGLSASFMALNLFK